jgi:hypothetical protein
MTPDTPYPLKHRFLPVYLCTSVRQSAPVKDSRAFWTLPQPVQISEKIHRLQNAANRLPDLIRGPNTQVHKYFPMEKGEGVGLHDF